MRFHGERRTRPLSSHAEAKAEPLIDHSLETLLSSGQFTLDAGGHIRIQGEGGSHEIIMHQGMMMSRHRNSSRVHQRIG
jgi:hypothetical protein